MRFALAIGLLLLSLPAASAAGGGNTLDFTFSTFASATLHASSVVSGDEATTIRGYMDTNQDGTVTQPEVNEFTQSFKDLLSKSTRDDIKGNMSLDGRKPTSVNVNTLTITGATGSTSSSAEMTATIDVAVTFTPDSGDTHTLVVQGTSKSGDATTETTVRAPGSFIISSTSGLPSPTLSPDKSSVSFIDTSANGQTSTIVFGKAAAAKSPMPASVLVAVILVGVAAMARRRD